MRNLRNLTGEKFTRWTVKIDSFARNKSGSLVCFCECDCGTQRMVNRKNLLSGASRSCGCLKSDLSKAKFGIKRGKNRYRKIKNGYIGYTNNNTKFYFDKEDYKLVEKYTWSEHDDGTNIYARTLYDRYYDDSGKRHNIYIMMHQLLQKTYYSNKDGLVMDHINGNTMDNRKQNLRETTRQKNMINIKTPRSNKTGHKGIYKTANGKFQARIHINKKTVYLGVYEIYEDAVRVREAAEIEYYGEYRRK